MRNLVTLWLAIFGSSGDFLETRKGTEADFWQQARGSALQAARQWPSGRGWWYLAKRFFMRQVVPPVLVFGTVITLLLAGFGGWVAVGGEAEVEERALARKQAIERLEQRVEKAKQGASHGER